MVLNYTIISMQRGTMIQHVRIVSKEYTKKGHHRNMQHTFIGRLCSRLWASPGVSLVHKSLCSAARMARTKVQRKKQPSAYLQRAAEQHVLDLIDVLVCEALYADADCIATVQSYGIMPVIRIKQEQYNIMKEVDELSGYISFARAEEDYERKLSYRYRIFEHLPSWKM